MNQPLEVSDFSKGITDNYLAGPTNAGQEFDNLLLNNNKKPFTRFGSQLRDYTNGQNPGGVQRISFIWDHRDQVMEQSARDIAYYDTVYNTLFGPDGNSAFGDGDDTNHISVAVWNNHSFGVNDSFCDPIKIFKDDSDDFQVRTAGMPTIAAPTVTSSGGIGSTYIYAFHYSYTYSVEGVEFIDEGPTVQVQLTDVGAPNVNTVHITNIPVIANGDTGNYETDVIVVKIFRTQDGGLTLNYVGSVTNGTTIYDDTASDASIIDNVAIYTTGGVVDNDPPPPAKFIHIANNTALYGFVEEDGVPIPNRLRQSIQGDPDACPADFNDDVQMDITGISSIQGTFIVFTRTQTYRVDGLFDSQGRGGLLHLKISDTVGTISNDSIVQVDDGLLFCSEQGWYFCDGYSCKKISHHLNQTYKNLISDSTMERNIWGAYDRSEKRVWWAMKRRPASVDNDSCYILDLQWGLSDESTFTTASNGENFAPTALLFKNGDLYRADKRGYVFVHEDGLTIDDLVDPNKHTDDWDSSTIIHQYKSCAFNFGTSFVRKFVSKILITLANVSNIAIQIFSNNDDGKKISALTEIRYESNIIWSDPEITWGTAGIIWNQLGLIEEKRMFPVPGLRCNYKQIEITNSYTAIANSDTFGMATIDATAKTITLNSAAFSWPLYAVGYFISFLNDDYTRQFLITERNSDTVLTVSDIPDNLPVTGSYKWLVQGYQKGDSLELLSYVIHYKLLTDSQKPFHSATDTGRNVS